MLFRGGKTVQKTEEAFSPLLYYSTLQILCDLGMLAGISHNVKDKFQIYCVLKHFRTFSIPQ
jgi:hypothetical protein